MLGRTVSDPDLTDDDDLSAPGAPAEVLQARIDAAGVRLDKALADVFPTLSRARLQALLAEGAVNRDGAVLTGGSAKAQPGLYSVALPPVAPATPQPEVIDRLLDAAAAKRARALGLAIRLACDLSGRSPQLLANATARVKGGDLRLTATEGYADVLLGEQTKKRAKALAEAMDLGLRI